MACFVSPDGSRLLATAYTGIHEDGLNYLVPVGGPEEWRRLAHRPSGGLLQPYAPMNGAVFTPDSRRAYFYRGLEIADRST